MSQLIAHLFGDYILQSEWMAVNKTKRSWPALVHALLYSLCFVPVVGWTVSQVVCERGDAVITWPHFRWLPWLVIFSTHFLIDRFGLARYVVWAKNWMAARWIFTSTDLYRTRQRNHPWKECRETGFSGSVPDYMAKWTLIIADNTLHLAINYAALRWL